MPDPLPQPERDSQEGQEDDRAEALESPGEQRPPAVEKDFQAAWSELMDEYQFLSELGYNPVAASEVRREVGGREAIMVEIPNDNGRPAYVRLENIQEWINRLKDEKALVRAGEELDAAYGDNDSDESKEAAEAQYGGKDRLKAEELETMRGDLEALSGSVQRLYRELDQRDQQRLYPLIFPEDVDAVGQAASNLRSVLEAQGMNAEALGNAIIFIAAAIDAIENVGQREGKLYEDKENQVYEDDESLSRVSGALRGMFESGEDTVEKLSGMKKEETTYLTDALRRLTYSVEERYRYVERKRSALENY